MLMSSTSVDFSLGLAFGVAASAICMLVGVGATFREPRVWRMALSLLTFVSMLWVYLQSWPAHEAGHTHTYQDPHPLRFIFGNAFLLTSVWLFSLSRDVRGAAAAYAHLLTWTLTGVALISVSLAHWTDWFEPVLLLRWVQALLLITLVHLHFQRLRSAGFKRLSLVAWEGVRLGLLVLVLAQAVDIQWGSRCLEYLIGGPWVLWVLAGAVLAHELASFGREVMHKEDAIRHNAMKQLEEEVRRRTQDLEEAREQSERMGALQRDFLATMSHELRTPLATIVGISRMVAQSGSLPRTSSRDLGTVERLALQLLQMVDEGLDFVRERGELGALVERPVNMRVLLRDIESIARWLSQQQGNQLRVLPMRGIPTALVFEERRLRQLIINLLSNAGRYCSNGVVTLGLEFHESSQKCSLRWTVSDTGRGMSTDDMERMFEPFVKSRDSKGLGIGLALVKRLSNELGAQIKVQSEVSLGSLFVVQVPVKMVAASGQDQRINHEVEASADSDRVITMPMGLLADAETRELDFDRVRGFVKLGQLSEIEDWIRQAKVQEQISDTLLRLLARMERAVVDVDLEKVGYLIDQIDPPLSRS